jgi:hypothetical protein
MRERDLARPDVGTAEFVDETLERQPFPACREQLGLGATRAPAADLAGERDVLIAVELELHHAAAVGHPEVVREELRKALPVVRDDGGDHRRRRRARGVGEGLGGRAGAASSAKRARAWSSWSRS